MLSVTLNGPFYIYCTKKIKHKSMPSVMQVYDMELEGIKEEYESINWRF